MERRSSFLAVELTLGNLSRSRHESIGDVSLRTPISLALLYQVLCLARWHYNWLFSSFYHSYQRRRQQLRLRCQMELESCATPMIRHSHRYFQQQSLRMFLHPLGTNPKVMSMDGFHHHL